MYYVLEDDSDRYEDAGHIEEYPALGEDTSLGVGHRVDTALTRPLRFKMNPAWGKDPLLIMGTEILLMRRDLVSAIEEAGVDNIDAYDAIVHNPYTGKDLPDYRAVNIIGLVSAADLDESDYESFGAPPHIDALFARVAIDEVRALGLLMFRMQESVSMLIVHERVKRHLEPRFPQLLFIPAGAGS